MRKRVLSLLIVFTLCLTLLPTAAFAEGGEGNIISGSSIGESSEGGGVLVPSGGTTEGGGKYIAEFAAGEDAASVIKSDGTDGGTFTSLTEALSKAAETATPSSCWQTIRRIGATSKRVSIPPWPSSRQRSRST